MACSGSPSIHGSIPALMIDALGLGVQMMVLNWERHGPVPAVIDQAPEPSDAEQPKAFSLIEAIQAIDAGLVRCPLGSSGDHHVQ